MFEAHKRISGKMYFGIVFLPFIFAWFTLRKGYSLNAKILSFCWMGLVLMVLSDSFTDRFQSNLEQEITTSNEQNLNSGDRSVVEKWIYEDLKDEMRNEMTETALLRSDTIHDLQFPYEGGSKLGIILYKRKDSRDAVISISKGVIMITYGNSKIHVKFDDGEVISYVVSSPKAGVHNAVVVYDQKDFLKRLRAAKKIIIEAPIYDKGDLQFTFTNPGLKLDF